MAVLVTTFGPDPGSGAFEYGVELALVADTGVDLLHVHPATRRSDGDPPTGRAAEALAARARETELVGDVAVETGDPAVLVPAYAAEDVGCVVVERPRAGHEPRRDAVRRLLDRLSVPSVVVPREGQATVAGRSHGLRSR